MKSPAELKVAARRQWESSALRESRLLDGASAWPLLFSIGRPSPRKISSALDDVKQHIEAWRHVRVGQVLWEPVRYRAASSPVDIPVAWKLSKPSEWVEAADESSVRQEFQAMATLVEQTASEFHSLLVRRRSLWLGKPLDEVVQAARLAMAVAPGCAQGQPLRTISLEGIDTKFFERHSRLVTALLDVRFDGEVSLIGLENFLGAFREGEHWLLVVDLDGSLLPFRKMRVRSSELKEGDLPGSCLLIIENESCQHHLPEAKETVAVLGAGFDLGWTEGSWLATKKVAYWGDIDSWGLQFLAKARTAIPHVEPLLMTEADFDEFNQAAVREPVVAGTVVPDELTDAESKLYRRLLGESRGRLEQEFLPVSKVQQRIVDWLNASRQPPA
ncbi:MAG: DUF2220 family protein [Pirellulaceae bacterium]|nr:DUF2220 family protein [Pirellulaceae bacterium]